jgi:uncharacterized membrane protein
VPSSPTQTLRRGAPSAAGQAPAPARALAVILLVLAAAGLAVAIDLILVHARAHAGAANICDVSEHVNCSKVATSAWSMFLGVPLAAWGALAYLMVTALAVAALVRRRPHPAWPGGLLVVVSGAMSGTALVLAAISHFVIRSLCVVCAVSWAISFALLFVSWRLARRAGSVPSAVSQDLRALRSRPRPAALAAGLLALLSGGLIAWYSRAPAPGAGEGRALGGPIGPPGSILVYEYSDYQCPFCARMHEQVKGILAGRPDLRVVRRQFPLDDACNPMITRQFHVGACDQARAAICAEEQGRFEEMDDALFASQGTHAPLEQVAQAAGLDLARLRRCMSSPETEQRLQAEIASGIAAGVRATPSYAHQGRVYQGQLPPVMGGPGGVAKEP